MRKLALALLTAAAAGIPAAALSQDAPQTVEDYVCAFAGECPDAAEEEPARPRLEATRGFSLSTPSSGVRDAPSATPAARRPPRRRARGATAGAPRRPAAAQGQRVNLRLNFETGSARLTGAAEAQARVFGQSLLLPQLLNMHFRIEGHTDSVGSRAMNEALSQRRAQSVADFLVGMGVDRARLDVRGYGPDRPIPGTSASDGENRRVEAVRTS
jgi:OmpA-OmpF porin, OOP family